MCCETQKAIYQTWSEGERIANTAFQEAGIIQEFEDK